MLRMYFINFVLKEFLPKNRKRAMGMNSGINIYEFNNKIIGRGAKYE
jgi:hypothetical protein